MNFSSSVGRGFRASRLVIHPDGQVFKFKKLVSTPAFLDLKHFAYSYFIYLETCLRFLTSVIRGHCIYFKCSAMSMCHGLMVFSIVCCNLVWPLGRVCGRPSGGVAAGSLRWRHSLGWGDGRLAAQRREGARLPNKVEQLRARTEMGSGAYRGTFR